MRSGFFRLPALAVMLAFAACTWHGPGPEVWAGATPHQPSGFQTAGDWQGAGHGECQWSAANAASRITGDVPLPAFPPAIAAAWVEGTGVLPRGPAAASASIRFMALASGALTGPPLRI